MENYVAGQLAALGAAVALGAAGGLVYDLLRVLRRRRPGLTHAADAVFGGMCLLGALWALTRVGGGEPQLYLLLGAGAGMLLYLLAAAPLLRPLMWPESWRGFCGCPWIFAAIRQKNCCRKQKRASILRQSTLY